jgi:hypothetical protein
MSDYDPSELVAVCESILDDGEISSDEIYRLAEWLNNHRDACHHWPGSLLVPLLQEVWADGKLTKTEIRKIGGLLIRIRKEWAKEQIEIAIDDAMEAAEAIIDFMDLNQPRLPTIPCVVKVKSHSERGVLYNVDLNGPTCTCPDWRSYRAHLPEGHLGRCCKHVLDAYGKIEPQAGWPSWLGCLVENRIPPHPQKQWMVIQVKRSPALLSTAPSGWADVYASSDGGFYERFGYNVIEDRWSYGMEPDGSRKILQALASAQSLPPVLRR